MNKMYVFFLGWEGRAGCGKIGEKKLNKKNKYIYIYTYVYFFGRLVAGKSAAKKLNKYNIYIFFLKGWPWEIGRHNKAVLVCFAEIAPEKGTQKKPASNIAFIFQTFICCLDLGPENECLKSR